MCVFTPARALTVKRLKKRDTENTRDPPTPGPSPFTGAHPFPQSTRTLWVSLSPLGEQEQGQSGRQKVSCLSGRRPRPMLLLSPAAAAFPNAAVATNHQPALDSSAEAGFHDVIKWALPTVRGPPAGPNEPLRLILTTECNMYQFWQAQVLLSSAMDVGQPDPFTHIVVGCETTHATHSEAASHSDAGGADNIVPADMWRSSVHPNCSVHYAPKSPHASTFPWFNKPWGVRHWARNAPPKERIVVLLDPDQFFLAPITQGVRPLSQMLGLDRLPSMLPNHLRSDQPRPGLAVAQKYGLGGHWVNKFNASRICGAAPPPCTAYPDVSAAEGFYNVGPPYLWHASDVGLLADAWWNGMKPAFDEDIAGRCGASGLDDPSCQTDIQLDMYAYDLAASASGVAHVQLEHFMVSSAETDGEAWDYVDALPSMSCHSPSFPTGSLRPTLVHACQHYVACADGSSLAPNNGCGADVALWNFHKGHVPADLFTECDEPLLVEPPDDLFNVQTTRSGRHNAFMICQLTSLVNRGLRAYRRKNCAPGWNEAECIRLDIDQTTRSTRRHGGRCALRSEGENGRPG